jgi:signal transduction histidine kinase
MTGPAAPDSRRTRRLLDEPLRVCIDTMLDPFGAYEAIRDERGTIVDFEIVQVNDPACAALGVAREQQIGQRLCELFPTVRPSGDFETYVRVVDTGVPFIQDGFERSGRFWDMRVSRLGDGFVASWRDVTAREQLERDLQQSNEALRARAEELSVMMDATPATVFISTDPDCREIRGSRLAHDLLRMPPAANVTMTPGTDAPPPPAHFTVWQDGVRLAPDELPMQRAARGAELRNFEEEIVFDDGERVWMYGNAVPLRNADGTPRGAIAAFVDISQYKRAEQELRVALEGKDQFLATISHELRTPLTAVMGYAQMLQTGAVRPDRQRHAVDTISRNAALQLQLIDDILDVSGIIRGKLVLDRHPVDLTTILDAAITTVLLTAERKRIQVTRDLAPGHWIVDGDERRLHQVFGNVLTNSVKFTPEGGRIHVSLQPGGDALEIRISDTGIGIAADFLPRMFERFTQEEGGTTREHGGLGIGLSIAQYLVTEHGGTISAHSDGPGQGATLCIVLPQGTGEAAPQTIQLRSLT